MKQIDYLKLVATGRNSSYYTRPSEADEALKGLIAYGGATAWIVTFGVAVAAGLLGVHLEFPTVAKPLAFVALFTFGLLISCLFVSEYPRFVRYLIAGASASVVLALIVGWYWSELDPWYLYFPLFLLASLVASAATRQLG